MKTNAASRVRKPPRYDAVASHYDSVMRPLERWLLARLRVTVFSKLSGAVRLLEVGAGTGANFSLYPYETSVTASELSTKMIEQALGKSWSKHVSIVQNSAEQLPFVDDSFDAAVVTLVFCSVASPQESFSELRRVVKGGGTVALLEHVRPNGLLGYVFDLLSVFTVALFDDHFNRRTADDARDAGLSVLEVTRHAFGIFNVIVCRV